MVAGAVDSDETGWDDFAEEGEIGGETLGDCHVGFGEEGADVLG